MVLIEKAIPAKIPASSLVEVTVAMVLMVAIFAIGLTIFLNISASSASLQKTKYTIQLKHLAVEIKQQQNFINEQIIDGNVVISKEIKSYAGSNDLIYLILQAKDVNGKQLAKHKELIYSIDYE